MKELTQSAIISVSGLPGSGRHMTFSAGREGLNALAGLTDADALFSLSVNVLVKPWRANGVHLSGALQSKLQQSCVVTLEPVESVLSFDFERRFLPEDDGRNTNRPDIERELTIDPEADDLPDVMSGSSISIWDVVLEELNLRIDPFPRSPGATAPHPETPVTGKEPTHKPFSDLKALITEKKTEH